MPSDLTSDQRREYVERLRKECDYYVSCEAQWESPLCLFPISWVLYTLDEIDELRREVAKLKGASDAE